MQNDAIDRSRRDWMTALAAAGAFGAAGLTGLIRRAHAMARRPFAEGVQQMKGEVRINNVLAKPGSIVQPGDTVVTGAASQVVFVIGSDAYLLREQSRLQISGERGGTSASGEVKAAVVKVLNVLSGKLLSVFGKGEKRIVTPTVTVGVRGTGVYIESESKRSYVCTCYGETLLEAKGSGAREQVRSTYHDAPRYVYAAGAPEAITKAPVINHSDDELTMLEALMGRSPPFAVGDSMRRY